MLVNQEKCRCCGYKVPLYFWFVLSGAICDIIQAFLDYLIYLVYVFEWERATICWTLSYTLSIVVRHSSHRLLVFGEFEGSYCGSLSRTYMAYSSSIVISMLANHLLVSMLNFSHRTAWIVTLLWTGIYNFFMLKASWRKKPAPSSGKSVPSSAVPTGITSSSGLSSMEGGAMKDMEGGSSSSVKSIITSPSKPRTT
jgi:hypothetical protein